MAPPNTLRHVPRRPVHVPPDAATSHALPPLGPCSRSRPQTLGASPTHPTLAPCLNPDAPTRTLLVPLPPPPPPRSPAHVVPLCHEALAGIEAASACARAHEDVSQVRSRRREAFMQPRSAKCSLQSAMPRAYVRKQGRPAQHRSARHGRTRQQWVTPPMHRQQRHPYVDATGRCCVAHSRRHAAACPTLAAPTAGLGARSITGASKGLSRSGPPPHGGRTGRSGGG